VIKLATAWRLVAESCNFVSLKHTGLLAEPHFDIAAGQVPNELDDLISWRFRRALRDCDTSERGQAVS
jgi:hypothetical protein